MKHKSFLLCAGIIAVCFLYTGSAYMSQFYRLMDFYDAQTVDVITSGLNYFLQAAGIGIIAVGIRKRPKTFESKNLFLGLLLTGTVFMAVSQLSQNAAVIVAAGCIFNLHIGAYFAFYLAILAKSVSPKHSGICYGTAYAVGSVGTYLFSLIGDDFLTSKGITALYLALAILTAVLVILPDKVNVPQQTGEKKADNSFLQYIIPMLVIMMIISVVGSGLYYSYPQAENVNWNLIRAFYAIGLIGAGLLFDKSRFVGTICTVAGLTYPLIAVALIGQGVSGTTSMALSYTFRGLISVYCIVTFTDLCNRGENRFYLAAAGLLLSRLTEAVLSVLLIYIHIPDLWQLVFCAVCFVPVLLLLFILQNKKNTIPAADSEKRLALFSEEYGLTLREAEILQRLSEGLTDQEIAELCFVSKSTVRFHISNIMKKTGTSTRAETIRALKKY